jgi:probable phosphomutase (TIGR03848 family)
MTRFLLIRHGENDTVGRSLAGRQKGVGLNSAGRQQARELVRRLQGWELAAIVSSPMERTLETAAPLAEDRGQPVVVREGINEVDYGEWTGLTLEELRERPGWKEYNAFRSGIRIPGGELISEVQTRMVDELERLGRLHPSSTLALFSHGDPIRTVLAHAMGMPLDLITRLTISTASVSILDLSRYGPTIQGINCTGPVALI